MEAEKFGDRITRIRKGKGLSQKAVADEAKITPTALNYYEKNKREPRFEVLCEIARALGVPVGELLEDPLPSVDIIERKKQRLEREFDKLPSDKLSTLLSVLGSSIDYITRASDDEQPIFADRFSKIIRCFGEMILQSFEMRNARTYVPSAYFAFLRQYQILTKVMNEQREYLVKSALKNARWPDELRQLIDEEE